MTYKYKKLQNFNPMPSVLSKGSHDKEWVRTHDLSILDTSVVTNFDSRKKIIWNAFYVFLLDFIKSDKLFDNSSRVIIEKQSGFISLYLKGKTRRSRIDVKDASTGACAIMHLCKL
tara:strand:- start:323 stop:670 length:348 start_codon:yes stop_codon:yes gene_type:complete